MNADVTIRILTQGMTDESLDPCWVIREDAFDEQRYRYIDMCITAVREAYPAADVDTEHGNGLASMRIYANYDNERVIREDVDLILMETFQTWCETIPAEAYRN